MKRAIFILGRKMRKTTPILVVLCALITVPLAPIFAATPYCNPNDLTTVPVTGSNKDSCATLACDTLGQTTMDADKQGIVACMASADSKGVTVDCKTTSCVWKTTTKTSGAGSLGFYMQIYDDGGGCFGCGQYYCDHKNPKTNDCTCPSNSSVETADFSAHQWSGGSCSGSCYYIISICE